MGETFAFAGDAYVGGIVAQQLQQAGYELARDLGDADFIISYCLAQSQLEDVYLGSGGAIESAKPGCCLVDLSPSTPTLAKETYAIARVNELQALDAPMVLKDPCAHDAFGDPSNVMVLAGGEDSAFDQAASLLRVLAGDVRLVGPAGMGQLAKAACTLQQAASLVALVEAQALAQLAQGPLDAAVAAAVDAGLAPASARGICAAIADRHFHGSHTCQVMMGELSAAVSAADDNDLVLAQAEAGQHLFELMMVVGGAELPAPALALAYAGDEECASYGLDWNRADGLYEHAHDHEHGGADSRAGDYDDYGYGYGEEEDEYAGYGGFPSR